MTRKERLHRCYFNMELDRPAIYSRTFFPRNDPTYDRLKAYLDSHTELKTRWQAEQFDEELPIDSYTEPHSEDFERWVQILHTPEGDLRKTNLIGLQGQSGLHETHFINSAEDAEKYLSLPLPKVEGDTSSFLIEKTNIGDKGIVDIDLGFNPAGFTAELCGSENFAMMSITDREIIHRLCERHMNIIMNRLQFLLYNKTGPYFSMLGEEYIVPPLHGPEDFKDFNTKYDKPIIDAIHDAGGRIHIHCHGPIKTVFQEFINMDVNVLHPFESSPQGDITVKEAKELARDKMCLEGNIQIHRFYEASVEEIIQETEQLIADAFDDHKGLIVSPTASPYMHGQGEECFQTFKAMIDTVLNYC